MTVDLEARTDLLKMAELMVTNAALLKALGQVVVTNTDLLKDIAETGNATVTEVKAIRARLAKLEEFLVK